MPPKMSTMATPSEAVRWPAQVWLSTRRMMLASDLTVQPLNFDSVSYESTRVSRAVSPRAGGEPYPGNLLDAPRRDASLSPFLGLDCRLLD